jgi:hypothetical protein
MAQIPENILRRSAEARAKKEGRPVDEILAEMKGETAPSDSPPADSAPSAQTPPPEGEVPPSGDGESRALAAPEPESKTAAAGEPVRTPTASASAGATASGAVSGAALLTAVAGARKMPESLVLRSATARSRTAGGTVDDVLLAWAEEEGIDISSLPAAAETPDTFPSPQIPPPEEEAPDRATEGTGADSGRGVEVSTAQPPSSDSVAPVAASAAAGTAVAVLEDEEPEEDEPSPNGAKSDRLLTVIRAGEVQRIRSEPTDRVTVWPHLLAIEFVALLVVLTLLIALSVFLDAPLLEFANFNEQPNPSKAPWYFLGLQELLAYFDPQVAGIIIPTFGALAIAIIPYIDKNPSVKPSHRKLAIMIFTFFIMAAAVLTIFGSFFRGPGFNFTFPWEDGIFFDDLKSLLE